MQLGDHLITPRVGYTHHGVYVGFGKVIHYSGYTGGVKEGVMLTSLEEFEQGMQARVIRHDFRRYSAKRIVERAYSRLGEDDYNLLLNNCEHFVSWCIWGVRSSQQVKQAMLGVAMVAGYLFAMWD